MLFSIIIPTYNAKDFIRNCLDSILAQTFTKFEVVIVDDGSSDGTEKILDAYAESDKRFRVFHFSNAGVSVARRRGVSLASGKYLLFVDSDDTVEPELLENVYETIVAFNEPDVIRYQARLLGDSPLKDHNRYNFFDVQRVSSSGVEALRAWSIPGKKYAVYWLFAFKKTIFSNFLFIPDLRCHEDVALIPILIAVAKKVVTINYTGYNYTYANSSSLTNTRSKAAERSRAIDFVTAYNYAIENFNKIDGVSVSDLAFFVEDFNIRLRDKFNSLDDSLKEELAPLFGM